MKIRRPKRHNVFKPPPDGISKVLTYHTARHTFVTTVTLSNDVPIESVSAILGHKRIATTQHYAKMMDKKLEEDKRKWAERLVGLITEDLRWIEMNIR